MARRTGGWMQNPWAPWVAFLVYLAATLLLAWLLLDQADFLDGKSTTTTTSFPVSVSADDDGNIEVEPTSGSTENAATRQIVEEKKRSLTTQIIVTTIAGATWLLLPLKFLWDEQTANAEAARKENENEAEHRREINTTMREQVTAAIKNHYGPLLYRQRDIASWADRASRSPTSPDIRQRLLYCVAQYCEVSERIRQAGTVLLLRSLSLEQAAAEANGRLKERVYSAINTSGREDFALAQAVRAPGAVKDEATRYVAVDHFVSRLDVAPLKQVRDDFMARTATTDELFALRDAAAAAADALSHGMNDVFKEWYSPARA